MQSKLPLANRILNHFLFVFSTVKGAPEGCLAGPVRAGGGPGAQILGGGPLKPYVRSKFPVQEKLAPAYSKNKKNNM